MFVYGSEIQDIKKRCSENFKTVKTRWTNV